MFVNVSWCEPYVAVVVAGGVNEQRPVGTGPAMDFLAAKLMGSRHRRSKDMLLDPKTGKNKTAAMGGNKRRRPAR